MEGATRLVPPPDDEQSRLGDGFGPGDLRAALSGEGAIPSGREVFNLPLHHLLQPGAESFPLRRRHPTVSLDEPTGNDAANSREAVDPERDAAAAAAVGKEREKEILKAIASLPEDQREAITLSLIDDFAIPEIAAIMGCDEKAVENKLYRGRLRLREKLRHLNR